MAGGISIWGMESMSSTERKPKILVVDDLKENVVLMERFLAPAGFDVIPAYNGAEALRCVAVHSPDLVLLDLIMPEVDGYQVCEALKQNPNTHHIPIVVVSGLTDRDAHVKALQAGADDFITKPFDSFILRARVESSLKAKFLQDQIFEYQRKLQGQNDNLETAVRERTAQVMRTQQVAVFSLAKLAESRDTETGKHLERMRLYSREVASEIITLEKYRDEFDEDFVEQIYKSSPLHDIGKVGIPDCILLKPGKLTVEEFDIMKTHSVIGGDTLKAADIEAGTHSFLAMGRDIAYSHHEKWDGSGYPFGLKGEDIPLASRIVAIGDVYDALTSKRPYKEAFSHEKSMGIILEGRGSHFDPDVVDAFVAREENITAIREKMQDTDCVSTFQRLVESIEHATP